MLASAKLDTIASHISKALMDDHISDEEFKLIMEELNKYKAMKEETPMFSVWLRLRNWRKHK